MMDKQHEATGDLNESMGVLIIRLEYEAVREDGKLPSGGFIEVDDVYRTDASEDNYCVGGCERGTAHWVIFLFPRDAFGNVFGWLMLSDTPAAFTERVARVANRRHTVAALMEVAVPQE
jgi:hypothetical protein